MVNYTMTDEHGAPDLELKITITGTNDGPVAVDDTASVNEDASISGSSPPRQRRRSRRDPRLRAGQSGPRPDVQRQRQLELRCGSYDSLAAGEPLVLTIPYTVTDEHGAPDTGELKITITGTNDAPALTGTQATLAGGTEDVAYIVSAASLLAGFTDVDTGDVLPCSASSADHGSVVDNGNGTYTITPTANYNGTVTLSYSVVDGHGGVTPATLSFNLAAVNDPAVDHRRLQRLGDRGHAGQPGRSGRHGHGLLVRRRQSAEPFVPVASTATASGYGSYTVSAAGVWTYTLNNANATVNALATGILLIDTFTVQSADGTTQTITVTITGMTDAIVLPLTENGADPNDNDSLVGSNASGFLLVNGTNAGETLTGDTSSNDKDIINGFGGDDNVNAVTQLTKCMAALATTPLTARTADLLYGQAGNRHHSWQRNC